MRKILPPRTLVILLLAAGACGGPSLEATARLVLPVSAGDPVVLLGERLSSTVPDDLQDRFAVYVATPGLLAPSTPVQGTYQRTPGGVRFVPDFPFAEGVDYLVFVDEALGQLDSDSAARVTRATRSFVPFELFGPALPSPPRVERIYPTSDVLPENVIRFYIYFSSAMQRGSAERLVRLYRSDGRRITSAFMTFKQELWSPDQRRLTVLLDPGRIKRGVGTNRRLGPALEAGQRYKLVVEGGWQDAHGQVLTTRSEKAFRVEPAMRVALTHGDWTATAPIAGSRGPLALSFDRSLDHALLARMISVRSRQGDVILGSASLGREERAWQFHPRRPWLPGAYSIVVSAGLEDVAGNNLRGPLDRDLGVGAKDVAEIEIAFDVEAP